MLKNILKKKAIYGLLLASFLLAGCQSNDIKASVLTPSEGTKTVLDESPVGIILNSKTSDVAKLVSHIVNKADYQSVVLLASTGYKNGDAKAFVYSAPADEVGSKIVFDSLNIASLKKSGLFFDLDKIKKGSYWSSVVVAEVAAQFPNAKIITVSVGNDVDEAKASVIASALKNNIDGKKLVISIADFESPNENISEFSRDFSNEIMRTGSTDKFVNLAAKNKSALLVFAKYLESNGSRKSSFVDNDLQEVIYMKGASRGSNNVFLVAFGDIMLGRHVRELMNKNGLSYPFEKMDQNYLNNTDILMANLEGPIAKKAIATSKTIAFRFMTDVAPLLKSEGFNLLSLANNHAYDMGAEGYVSTKDVLKEIGVDYFGDAREVNGDSSIVKIVRGQNIAFVGLEEVVYRINDVKAVALVKELSDKGYKVIPFVHMGVEYQHKPSKRQVEFFHKMIDAGAFAVIAHHPHVVEGYESYKGHPIFFSLGNAVFDQYFSPDTQEGLSLAWNIKANGADIYLMPFRIVRAQMQLMNEAERKEFFKRFVEYSTVSDSEREMLLSGKISI